jgi:hypothetical protein
VDVQTILPSQNAHPVESGGLAGLDKSATCLARDTGMIQITAQMRVLVAIEPVGPRGVTGMA